MTKQYKPQQAIYPLYSDCLEYLGLKSVGVRKEDIIPAFPFSQKAEGEWFPGRLSCFQVEVRHCKLDMLINLFLFQIRIFEVQAWDEL